MYEDMALLGPYLGLAQQGEEPLDAYCARVREALGEEAGWLLVIDGAPNELAIEAILPTGGGHVVVTSQSQSWSRVAPLNVPDLTEGDALTILDQDDEFLRLPPDQKAAAAKIAGGVPLCLVQLMGYRTVTGTEAAQAVRLFDDRRSELLRRAAPADHLSAEVALEQGMTALSDAAKELLNALTYLADQPLPLPADFPSETKESEISPVFSDRLVLEDAVAELRGFSFVEREGNLLSVHSLIQECLKNSHTETDSHRSRFMALLMVASALPDRADREDVAVQAVVLLPHVRALVDQLGHTPQLGGLLAPILNRLAPAYGFIGDRPSEARELRLALSLLDADSDQDDPLLRASILNNLSNCSADVRNFEEAVDLASQALASKRKYGAAPDSLAITLGTYGIHLESAGRLEEALKAHLEASDLLEHTGGRLLADAENDQSRVLHAFGRAEESRAMALQAAQHARSDPSAWNQMAEAHLELALLDEEAGDVQSALGEAERALVAAESFEGQSRARARALGSRGRLRGILGLSAEAIGDLRSALLITESVEGRTVDYGRILGNLGAALVRLGVEANLPQTAGEGLVTLRESYAHLTELLPADHPTAVNAEAMMRQAQQIALGREPA